MPLTREQVTSASRIMLPTYVAHSAFFGVLYLLDPQGRLQRAPGLTLARQLLPMEAWGAIFLAISVLMCAGLLLQGRRRFTFALYLYAVTLLIWAGIYAGAVFVNPDASYGSFVWPLGWAVACCASARTLERHES